MTVKQTAQPLPLAPASDMIAQALQVAHGCGPEALAGLASAGVTPLDLARSLLLHLPRFGHSATVSIRMRTDEALRLANRLINARAHVPVDVKGAPGELRTREAKLRVMDASLAMAIHGAFHYLGSPRSGAISYMLHGIEPNPHMPAAVFTTSHCDLTHMEPYLPDTVRLEEVLVLSRLVSFPWSPPNTLSFGLARLMDHLRIHTRYKLVLTYLDPNVGLRGTVYSASNWRLFGFEAKKRYLYVQGNYVTDREMITLHGTARFEALTKRLGRQLTRSTGPIEPLRLFAYPLHRSTARSLLNRVVSFPPSERLVGAS